ncbi:MAG: hypothetical protein JRI68_10160 [Deltaproteobacteria bacterium]|nr:hypothetical protein [Deltaproteobacteria bacterium]
MDEPTLLERLEAGQIVLLDRAEWVAASAGFEVVEEHDTRLSGMLQVVRSAAGLAAIEQPKPDQRVVRPLADMDAARAFVTDRLETYDRMWDGCGCKIDYSK